MDLVAAPETPEVAPVGVIYAQADGTMLLTDEGYKEAKLGRIFAATALRTSVVEERGGYIASSVFMVHLGIPETFPIHVNGCAARRGRPARGVPGRDHPQRLGGLGAAPTSTATVVWTNIWLDFRFLVSYGTPPPPAPGRVLQVAFALSPPSVGGAHVQKAVEEVFARNQGKLGYHLRDARPPPGPSTSSS